MGKVDFSALRETSIIAIPHLMPFRMEFHADAILSVVLIFLVSATETIGDTSALAASGLDRDVTTQETSGSIACDGFVSSLSSVFGCMPITSFSQNVGLVAMTKVVNRFTITSDCNHDPRLAFFRSSSIAGNTAGPQCWAKAVPL
ncbi:MAG: solute carrier family 23 protein [Ruminococcus callidus]